MSVECQFLFRSGSQLTGCLSDFHVQRTIGVALTVWQDVSLREVTVLCFTDATCVLLLDFCSVCDILRENFVRRRKKKLTLKRLSSPERNDWKLIHDIRQSNDQEGTALT